ncbi:MAG: U32 family peptidase [Rhodospirillales bacterium]|jgi:collagenase-like PrtC family protease|nr:U32 family peptidase [Rhodospirillales bacterium]
MSAAQPSTPKLSLGPLLYHWPAERRRDFYYRIADEADLDVVTLGEVVCAKREPFFADCLPGVIDRLQAAGKQVVIATLALLTTPRELAAIGELAAAGMTVEANDVTAVRVLAGQPFVAGPLINLFNEGSLEFLLHEGATRVVLPVELSERSIAILAAHNRDGETEVQVFGRQPLAISMRCYHARAYGLHKDSCQFVCERDPDGLPADQMDGRGLLSINGTQTLSHGYLVLLRELAGLRDAGVSHFRLSPQAGTDMVGVAALVRAVADGARDPAEAEAALRAMVGPVPFINGYLHGREGMAWVPAA